MHTRKITENKLDTPPGRFYTYYTQLINGSMKELYVIDFPGGGRGERNKTWQKNLKERQK